MQRISCYSISSVSSLQTTKAKHNDPSSPALHAESLQSHLHEALSVRSDVSELFFLTALPFLRFGNVNMILCRAMGVSRISLIDSSLPTSCCSNASASFALRWYCRASICTLALLLTLCCSQGCITGPSLIQHRFWWDLNLAHRECD